MMKSKINIPIVLTLMGFLFVYGGCKTDEQLKGKNSNAPKTDTVIISNMKFQPEHLNINKGDTVVWVNDDLVAHNVADEQGGKILSDTIAPGKYWKTVPEKNFHYFCSIHTTMKGEITVSR